MPRPITVAPYFVAVLAYAVGNQQTIAQRLFAVREDLIKPAWLLDLM